MKPLHHFFLVLLAIWMGVAMLVGITMLALMAGACS